jgi:steroid delta-isomerase-like uncharacterized protein
MPAPTSTTATEIEQIAERYGEAWNSQDLEAILSHHAEDGIFHLHAGGSDAAQGIDAVRAAFEGVLAQFPDIHFETVELTCSDFGWVLRSRMSGRLATSIEVEGESAGAGARIEVACVDAITVADGRIAAKHTYLDSLALAQQAGLAS